MGRCLHLDTLQRPPRQTTPRRVPTGVLRAIRNFRDEAPELRAWSLRFKDSRLERRFQDDYIRANLPYIRLAHVLAVLVWAVFGLMAQVVIDEGVGRDAFLRYGLGVPSVLISFGLTYLRGYARWWHWALSVTMVINGIIWASHRALVPEARLDWGYAGLMVVLAFNYIVSRQYFRYSVPAGLLIVAYYNVVVVSMIGDRPIDVFFGDYFLGVFTLVGIAGAYTLERFTRLLFLRERELDRERERSEGLLRNILPGPIADRLKARDVATDHGHIAEGLSDVTVVFADLVGFTQQAGRTRPAELVSALDSVFTRFDEIADRFGLEKIKTIGDAYMAVAGAPEARDDHVEAAAEMSLAALDGLRDARWPSGEPIGVRIGIATGPVVAGVIGRRKFAYDLWGDTVNTASRLESHGSPNRIQVTEAVYECLNDRYRFSAVHVVDLKGKGPTPTRFLLGRSETPTDNGHR